MTEYRGSQTRGPWQPTANVFWGQKKILSTGDGYLAGFSKCDTVQIFCVFPISVLWRKDFNQVKGQTPATADAMLV